MTTIPKQLWDTQRAALRICESYFQSSARTGALVQMPTGSGKTGIIAQISVSQSSNSAVLVVSPSESLTHQLIRELSGAFWRKIGIDPAGYGKSVHLLLPKREADLKSALKGGGANQILIGTLQALSQIQRENIRLYQQLVRTVGTVLVDEGHREPAAAWASAVRNLDAKTVIFSATPYRNDQRLFNISKTDIYYLSFEEAVSQKYIRDVVFQEVKGTSPAEFAAAVHNAVSSAKRSGAIPTEAKVIVRGRDHDSVVALHAAFVTVAGTGDVLSFHDRFNGKTSGKLNRVPDLSSRSETYLIHQYKLIEGVDEPRCGVLAIYDEFDNGRQLVQQVGRIIRNPSRSGSAPSLVLHREASPSFSVWDSYLRYDKLCASDPSQIPIRTSTALDAFLSSIPAVDYIDGSFRQGLSLGALSVDDLLFPKSCVVFESKALSLAKARKEIEDLLTDADCLTQAVFEAPSHSLVVLVSIKWGQSALLEKLYFPEPRLNVTTIRYKAPFVFFTDTTGIWPDEIGVLGDRLSMNKLKGLFPRGTSTRISRITAKNTDLGATAIRSRTLGARSLVESASFIGDDQHVVTQATARLAWGMRYVGFARGRVTDGSGVPCGLLEFVAWTDKLFAELTAGAAAHSYLERFMLSSGTPASVVPKSILVDIHALRGTFLRDGAELTLEDVCADIDASPWTEDPSYPYSFQIVANDAPISLGLRFDREREKYIVASEALSYFVDSTDRRVSAVGAINRDQALRIVTATPGVIYLGGDFYDLRNRIPSIRKAVASLLETIVELDSTKSEKGTGKTAGSKWPRNSLFGFVDSVISSSRAGAFGRPFEHVVCDDLDDEVADFIGVDEKASQRVVFIHAKAKKGSAGAGASNLYDVCSQAAKNLTYLRFAGEDIAPGSSKWSRPWAIKAYVVNNRIRKGGLSSGNLKALIRRVIASPATTREAWIVLGSILSKSALDKGLRNHESEPHSLQAAFLLMSLDAACKSVGVTLRVFCSP